MTEPVLFIGRWQPPHKGHLALVETALNEGRSVVIAHRDKHDSHTDPFTFDERCEAWDIMLRREGWDTRHVTHILIPDISEVRYGRDVGYKVTEISLDHATEQISGTKIREEMRGT